MNRIRNILVLVLLVLILLNLNGVGYVFFDLLGIFKFVYLFIIVILFFSTPIFTKYNSQFLWLSFFLILYLIFGIFATFIFGSFVEIFDKIISIIISIALNILFVNLFIKAKLSGNFSSILKKIYWLALFSSLSGLLITISGLYAYGNYKAGEGRISGFFANPNELGLMINFAISMTLFYILKKQSLKYIVFYFVLLYASVYTFSKASIITSLLITFLFLFYISLSKSHLVLRYKVYVISIISAVVIMWFSESIMSNWSIDQVHRITQTFRLLNGEIDSESTTGRSGLYQYGIQKIKSNPLIGYGIGTFSRFKEYELGIGSHNAFLLIIGEAGAIPFIFFLFNYFKLLVTTYLNQLIKERFIIYAISISLIIYFMGTHGVFHSRFVILFLSLITVMANSKTIEIKD